MKKTLLVLLLPLLAACSAADDVGPLPDTRRAGVEQAALAGELAAVKRMISHCEATPGDDAQAERWRERARELGDAQELYFHAARRFVAAEVEADDETRQRLLMEAHHAALRSQAAQPERSTEQLVQQIARTLHAQ